MLTRATPVRMRQLAPAPSFPIRLSLAQEAELLTAPRDQHAAVIEAIMCEAQNAALLSATVASIVNALAGLPEEAALQWLKTFRPSGHTQLPALRGWLIDADVDPAALRAAVHFHLDVTRGLQKLDELAADARVLGAGRAIVLHRLDLERIWRAACDQAIFAVRKLGAELGPQVIELYQLSVPVLVPLLAEARDGGTPCMDAEGRPFVPELPQRRRAPRRMVNQECLVHVRRNTVRAMIRDVAIGGFGLARLPADVARNDIVVVEMRNKRRFTGTVMWTKDGHAGIKLTTPLSPSDPLIAG